MVLYLLQHCECFWTINKVDCKSSLAKSPSSSNPMKICLTVSLTCQIYGKVEVHYNCHLLHINSCQRKSKHQEHFRVWSSSKAKRKENELKLNLKQTLYVLDVPSFRQMVEIFWGPMKLQNIRCSCNAHPNTHVH